MSTSGVSELSTTTLEIITEALELLGVLGEGESPTTDQVTSSKRTLNNLIKTLQADNFNLFARQNMYVFVNTDNREYELDYGSSVRFTTSYNTYATSAAAVATATSVTIADPTGISASDKICIRLDDGTAHWSTVSTVVSTTVSFSDALPDDAASGAVVHTYTTQGKRPKKVLEGYYRTYNSATDFTDVPLFLEGMSYYNQFSAKATTGQTNTLYFNPQRNTSFLSVWPTGTRDGDILFLVVQRDLDTFNLNTDEPDYPSEWFLPLSVMLAKHLAPKYGIPANDYARIATHAAEMYQIARGFDAETYTSVYFSPTDGG